MCRVIVPVCGRLHLNFFLHEFTTEIACKEAATLPYRSSITHDFLAPAPPAIIDQVSYRPTIRQWTATKPRVVDEMVGTLERRGNRLVITRSTPISPHTPSKQYGEQSGLSLVRFVTCVWTAAAQLVSSRLGKPVSQIQCVSSTLLGQDGATVDTRRQYMSWLCTYNCPGA
jgi:hypothetical protein